MPPLIRVLDNPRAYAHKRCAEEGMKRESHRGTTDRGVPPVVD